MQAFLFAIALVNATPDVGLEDHVVIENRDDGVVALVRGKRVDDSCCGDRAIRIGARGDVTWGDVQAAMRRLRPTSARLQLVPIGHAREHEAWAAPLEWPAEASASIAHGPVAEPVHVLVSESKRGLIVDGMPARDDDLRAKLRGSKKPITAVFSFDDALTLKHIGQRIELAHDAGATHLAVQCDCGTAPPPSVRLASTVTTSGLRRPSELTRTVVLDEASAQAALDDVVSDAKEDLVVILALTVDAAGVITNARVMKSSGDSSVDAQVQKAALRIRARPAEAPPAGCVTTKNSLCTPVPVATMIRHSVRVQPAS